MVKMVGMYGSEIHVCTIEDFVVQEIPPWKGKCIVCCKETTLQATWFGALCGSCKHVFGPDNTIGDIAKQRRELIGLTRRQLGDIVGLKPSTIKTYEWGVCPEGYFKKTEEVVVRMLK